LTSESCNHPFPDPWIYHGLSKQTEIGSWFLIESAEHMLETWTGSGIEKAFQVPGKLEAMPEDLFSDVQKSLRCLL